MRGYAIIVPFRVTDYVNPLWLTFKLCVSHVLPPSSTTLSLYALGWIFRFGDMVNVGGLVGKNLHIFAFTSPNHKRKCWKVIETLYKCIPSSKWV